MIIDAILYAIYLFIGLITSPLQLLSDVSVNSNIAIAINTANGYLQGLKPILPIDTLVAIILIYLGIEVLVFSYKMIMWGLRKIPGIS